MLGIYGNSKDEAIYPVYFVDAGKQKLDGANRYTLRFAPGQLPPVNAFWSLTMYELPASLLYANPLNRYLINSPMLPSLKRDADGGITLYVQNESPGAGQGGELAARAEGPVLRGDAALLAEARGAERQMEGAAAAACELSRKDQAMKIKSTICRAGVRDAQCRWRQSACASHRERNRSPSPSTISSAPNPICISAAS